MTEAEARQILDVMRQQEAKLPLSETEEEIRRSRARQRERGAQTW
jgi:hypothetical protein